MSQQTPDSSSTPAAVQPVKKKRGFFGFLFKTALGCTAFAVGSFIVLLLLLPSMLGGAVTKGATSEFADMYRGSLVVGEAHLAWFKEQRINGIVLRDPEGRDVAHASAVLPSIVSLIQSGKTKIGRVELELDADLVQDDHGVTNLQRALEPRPGPKSTKVKTSTEAGFDPIAWLAELDLQVVVKSQKLSWSDVDTRRLGIPFEIRDLTLEAQAKPHEPISVHVVGRVVSEQPGALRIEAKVHGPITPGKPWPFGKVDAQVQVEGFSSAMIDGIANLEGNLKEVLGNRFAFRLNATGVTPDAGDVEVSLDAERASIAVVGRFVDGSLRSTDKPGIVASFPAPRGFLAKYLTANLPPNQRLTIDAGAESAAKPWSLRVPTFNVPLPPAGARDLATLRPTLEAAQLELEVDLPSRFAVENDTTRAAGAPLAISDIHVSSHVTPRESAVVNVSAALDTGAPGELKLDTTIHDLWAKLAAKEIPIVDAHVEVRGIKTATIGAFAGEGERAQRALGATIDMTFDARGASLDGGRMELSVVGHDAAGSGGGEQNAVKRFVLAANANIEKGVLRASDTDKVTLTWNAPTEWLTQQIAAYVPAGFEVKPIGGPDAITLEITDLSVPLPDPKKGGDYIAALKSSATGSMKLDIAGANYTDETLRAAKTSVRVQNLHGVAKLEVLGAARFELSGEVAQDSSKSNLFVNVSTADVWRFAKPGAFDDPPPVDASFVLGQTPTTLIDLFVQRDQLASRMLGDKFWFRLDVHGATLKTGKISGGISSNRSSVLLEGTLDAGVFRTTGEDQLRAHIQIPAKILDEQLAAYLPKDSSLRWVGDIADVDLRVRDLSLPLPDFAHAQKFDAQALLDSFAANVHVGTHGIWWMDAHTRAANLDLSLREIALDVAIAPKTPLTVKFGADVVAGKQGRLDVDASVNDPWSVLAPNGKLAPIALHVQLKGLDTAVIDALANASAPKSNGKDAAALASGSIASLLGPEIALDVEARDLSTTGGSFQLEAKSESATLRASATMEKGTIVCAGEEGVDLTLTLKPAFVEQRSKDFLPANTRVRLAEGAGPLWVKVRDVRFALPTESTPAADSTKTTANPAPNAPPADPDAAMKATLDLVSKLALKIEATLPAIVYSDATTDAANRPVTLNDLHLSADIRPDALPVVDITGRVVDEPPGVIAIKLSALDPLAKLSAPHGLDTWRAKVAVKANQIPTAIVDLLAAQNGLLVEALGSRLEINVDAPEIALSAGTFSVDFHSDLHSVHADGHLADRTIVIDKVDGLLAKVGIGPLMSQKVVGQLVPMLFDIEKPAGSEPARFAVDDLHYPLDGDLSKLDATVRVDLGAVSYKLLPGLDGLLGDLGVAKNTTLPALRVPIRKGVASYDKLPIKLGGRDVFFSGSYDLSSQAMKLTTNLPLKLLGKKFGAKLESVREFADPETAVPIEISGTWKKPKFAIGDGFLEKLLEGAATKGLGGLLDGLGKKKKKD